MGTGARLPPAVRPEIAGQKYTLFMLKYLLLYLFSLKFGGTAKLTYLSWVWGTLLLVMD